MEDAAAPKWSLHVRASQAEDGALFAGPWRAFSHFASRQNQISNFHACTTLSLTNRE